MGKLRRVYMLEETTIVLEFDNSSTDDCKVTSVLFDTAVLAGIDHEKAIDVLVDGLKRMSKTVSECDERDEYDNEERAREAVK